MCRCPRSCAAMRLPLVLRLVLVLLHPLLRGLLRRQRRMIATSCACILIHRPPRILRLPLLFRVTRTARTTLNSSGTTMSQRLLLLSSHRCRSQPLLSSLLASLCGPSLCALSLLLQLLLPQPMLRTALLGTRVR